MVFGLKWFKSSRADPDSDPDSYPQEEVPEYMDLEDVDPGPYYARSPREAIQPEHVPAAPYDPRAKRSSVVTLANGIMSLIIFLFIVSGGVFFIVNQQVAAPGPLRQTRAVIVPPGATVSQIANRLEREGVIADSNLFLVAAYASKASNKLKAGEFLFHEKMSMLEVMDLLVGGKSLLHKITIPEGLTSEQILARIKEDPILTGEVGEIPPEGSLLPETYKFSRGTDRKSMIERMLKEHQRAVVRIWSRRDKDLPLKTPEELVILASIVEKETGKADERPRVASVFVNRLKRSMRLQSDPTIIYGIVGGKGSLGRPIRQSEIKRQTPYNTYQIEGLPPTAIANPGVDALEATANPSRTKDLYFVADGTGGHAFASTLREHQRNVARWRRLEKQAKDTAPAKSPATLAPLANAPKAEPPKMPLDLEVGRLPGSPAGSDPKARTTQ